MFVLGTNRFFSVNTFLLRKPNFSIFHRKCLIDISPYLRALANLECQNNYAYVCHFHNFIIIIRL